MNIVKAHVAGVWLHIPEGFDDIEKWIESIARTCYKSEDKITEESASKFVKMLKDRGHHAMLEHAVVTARLVGDRGASHEEVRHRIASFAQESTRYCNYSQGKFSNEISVVEQPDLIETNNPAIISEWMEAMADAERHYMRLIELGAPVGGARSVLPIALKAEIVITANLREWMHIFELRHNIVAHKIICQIMGEVEKKLSEYAPDIFNNRCWAAVVVPGNMNYEQMCKKFGWGMLPGGEYGREVNTREGHCDQVILVCDETYFDTLKRGADLPLCVVTGKDLAFCEDSVSFREVDGMFVHQRIKE